MQKMWRQRRGEASAEQAARQPRVSLFARRWRLLLPSSRSRRRAEDPRYMTDPGSPATSATAVAAYAATARHTRLQVQLGRPQGGGGVAEWGMSLVDDDANLVLQYRQLPQHLTLTPTLTLTSSLTLTLPSP